MIKLQLKTMIKVITVLGLMMINSTSYAALIFKFDNAEFPDVDFVGVESTGVHVYFGPDTLDIDDSFDILIGSTPGSDELVPAFNINFNLDGIEGFGFGGILNLKPFTEEFFVTIINKSGSFNVSGISAYFINNGNGANFQGIPQRPANAIDVEEPGSLWLLLLALVFMWRVVIVNTYHNV